MPVSFKELYDTFELLGMTNPMGQYEAYVCRQTGKIYCHSDYEDFADLEPPLPDDVEDEEKYARVPDKHELDLGKPLVLDFARERLSDDDYADVQEMFRRKGGYQKFKALLIRRGAREDWYAYEQEATERALRQWCKVNDLALSD